VHVLTERYNNECENSDPENNVDNASEYMKSNNGILQSHLNFKTSTTLGDRAFVALSPKTVEKDLKT